MRDTVTILLYLGLALLMVSAAIELSFISDTVSYLHARAGGAFAITLSPSSIIALHGKPLNLLVNQGHTSNGAAGTAFVLIGLGGILTLLLRQHTSTHPSSPLRRATHILYPTWLVLTLLSALLSLAALIYTFTLTAQHANQTINLTSEGTTTPITAPNSNGATSQLYTVNAWTPENWFSALLALDLASPADRSTITTHLYLAQGWRWNLIPLFLLGWEVCALACVDAWRWYHQRRRRGPSFAETGNLLSSQDSKTHTPRVDVAERRAWEHQAQSHSFPAASSGAKYSSQLQGQAQMLQQQQAPQVQVPISKTPVFAQSAWREGREGMI